MKKKIYDIVGKRKTLWLITLAVFVVGVIFNIISPATLDIQFTGGALFKYSFSDEIPVPVSAADAAVSVADAVVSALPEAVSSAADTSAADISGADVSLTDIEIIPDYSLNIDTKEAAAVISRALGEKVSVNISTRINLTDGDTNNKNLTVSLVENKSLNQQADAIIRAAMAQKYPNITLTHKESSSVNPTMGKEFFFKCLVAVILASVFMLIYVGLRFRKVGGLTAGACAIVAIIHDCLLVYFTFVVCRFPIDDNFIAVLLAIIGYSINSTIVIFDRIRENRRVLGPKATLAKLTNTSISETLGRTINTNATLLVAVLIVAIVASVYGLSSIMSFAIPMLVGVIAGTYSSLCLAPTLWCTWREHLDAKKSSK